MKFTKLISALSITLTCLPLALNAAEPVKQPNILFIAVDDLKPLAGAYGDKQVITPNIDAIANQGTMFANAYSQWPVCGPSRMSLMTGLRPETNGIMNLKDHIREVNPDVVTLPQLFKQNGYETAAVGKIFDPRNVESREKDDPASWSIAYEVPKASMKGKQKLAVESIDAPSVKFVDGNINARGIKLLKQMANKDKPFFLAIGYKRPHLPFTAPKKFFDLYNPAEFTLAPFQDAPKNSKPEFILNNNGEMRTYKPTPKAGEKVKPYPKGAFSEEHQRELIHGYYAAVSFVDSLVGDLVAELEKTGQADNTIIVFWGDHGFHLGDHGMWGKHTTMEKANHVPLIIKVPGQKPVIYKKPVGLMDIYPTLTELVGLKAPSNLQGDSLVPAIKELPEDKQPVAISQYKRRGAFGYSLRTENYRYTEWLSKHKKVVYRDLYDMTKDPGETVNVINDAKYKEVAAKLAQLLRENSSGLKRL
ncbi:sulfatase [Thalassomonas sp. M1454]|uniref:sulfatase n=1 Tax=Thalassomonas sp. M1454 TaxID=2594477 RepID=UPI0011808778|nr:sulfatase [Thalassomonas sp. M1454]TRX53948.1 sulfatase [Thalassomonas sp. M1454]